MKILKILIADDAPFVRDIFRHIMKRAGHEVVAEANDGNEAVAMALEKKPDLIIMDIVMPNKSGIEATKEIKELLPLTKIIACSTIDQENMILKAMESGAVEFIQKPFNASEVIKIIERVCAVNNIVGEKND
jgi:two-component system chemotaxis response regulator CheY